VYAPPGIFIDDVLITVIAYIANKIIIEKVEFLTMFCGVFPFFESPLD